MKVTVLSAHDVGSDLPLDHPAYDRLVVTGTADGLFALDPETGEATDDLLELSANGWVSAMTNYVDPKHYHEDGDVVEVALPDGETAEQDMTGLMRENAKARKMTKPERLEYCRGLLVEVARAEFERRDATPASWPHAKNLRISDPKAK